MSLEVWTKFHYLYRDAGNFKVFGSVTLRGQLGENARAEILKSMDEDGRFVAEQIGLPVLYEPLHCYTLGPSDSDVCTHEFSHFEQMELECLPSECDVWGAADDFAVAFRNINGWRMELSPNVVKFHTFL